MDKMKLYRNYSYDILINNFEPCLREYIAIQLLMSFGDDWREHIPEGVISEVAPLKEELDYESCSIEAFFDEISFLNLKDIAIFKNNFKLFGSFFGKLNNDRFVQIMDELNITRRKIAHAKSFFSELDFEKIVECLDALCQGDDSKEIIKYLKNAEYKNAKDIPPSFFEETGCQNNLPPEEYDIDGGFVGRAKEIGAIKKLIYSDQDRIITITGAGGVGKTAIALKFAYSILLSPDNPYEAIIWFSAKADKLSEKGILSVIPGIRNDEQLTMDILDIIDPKTIEIFRQSRVPAVSYKRHLYEIFKSQKCLLIIDNLETIYSDEDLIGLIKDVPRPTQVLITSRKGLGEIERRYPLPDFPEKDAMRLFRIVAKERGRMDLVSLKDERILELVRRVRCYPLLIKWSIGQVCLGKDINEAFAEIFAGGSEIAKFTFNDVFSLLSENSRTILYSLIIYGDKPVSKYVLMHLGNLSEDEFTSAIEELVLTSFVFPQIREGATEISTEYSMLTLTRGFVETKLDEEKKTRDVLQTRYYHLSEQIKEIEKSNSAYYQSLFSLGIKTPEEQVAFNYVKAAKNYGKQNDFENAERNFEQALKIAPKLSYAFMEYSKFEFYREHISRAHELAQEAVKIDPENYHTWFNYGISLRRAHKFDEAITMLEKAKELNPKHLPIFCELGRALTCNGQFEKADIELKQALREEKYPNYRHKIMTLQFLADNYKRWAESYRLRRDYEPTIVLLNKAIETIKEALAIAPNDFKLWHIYRNICKELGRAFAKVEGFKKGRPLLLECLKPYPKEVQISPEKETVAEACLSLVELSLKERVYDMKEIEEYLRIGCAHSKMGSKLHERLSNICKKLGFPTNDENAARISGVIKFYNVDKKYGIIESNGKIYTFVISAFRPRQTFGSENEAKGRIVSFKPAKHPRKEGAEIAVDILMQ